MIAQFFQSRSKTPADRGRWSKFLSQTYVKVYGVML